MQLSNVPEVRPARRLLFLACVLFAGLFVLNVVATALSFRNDDSDRWLNLLRLVPNLVVPVLIWRGYVVLAALAERAAIYKAALEDGLPKLQAAVDRQRLEGVTGMPDRLTTSPAASPRPDGPPASE